MSKRLTFSAPSVRLHPICSQKQFNRRFITSVSTPFADKKPVTPASAPVEPVHEGGTKQRGMGARVAIAPLWRFAGVHLPSASDLTEASSPINFPEFHASRCIAKRCQISQTLFDRSKTQRSLVEDAWLVQLSHSAFKPRLLARVSKFLSNSNISFLSWTCESNRIWRGRYL